MKFLQYICDCILGVSLFLLVTCGPDPLRYSTETGAPYAFVSHKSIGAVVTASDTSILKVCDTVHTLDSVMFLGMVIPQDVRVTKVGWKFGDETGDSLLQVAHAYKRGGFYYAKFSIFDGVGNSLSDSVLVCVNTPPDSVQLISPLEKSTVPASSLQLSWKGYDQDSFDSTLSYMVIVNHESRTDTIVRWDDTTSAVIDLSLYQGKKVDWLVMTKDLFGDVCLSSKGTFFVSSSSNKNVPLLSSLKVSEGTGTLSPVFSDSIFSYSDTISPETKSITITAVPQDTSSIISINNMELGKRDSISKLNIQPGIPNVVTIKVMSNDRLTEKSYTVTIQTAKTVVPTDTLYLRSLTVSEGKLTPATIPVEDSLLDTVSYLTSAITFTASANDSAAKIIINSADTIKSGESSLPVKLEYGLTVIPLQLFHHNGKNQKTYTISVFRQLVPDTLLASVELSAGTLRLSSSPVPDTLRDTVSYIDSFVVITPAAMDTTSVVSIDTVTLKSPVKFLSVKLDVGTRVVEINVTSSGSKKSKLYHLYIVRKSDSAIPLTMPPSGVSAVGSSVSKIMVTWDDDVNATYYTVQRSSQSDSGFTDVGISTSNSYCDTALDSGSTWNYRVSASNSKGTTGYSTVVSATTFLIPDFLKQPQSFTTVEGTYAVFTIGVKGIPTPLCQWQKNEKNINVTSLSCTTTVLTLNDNNAKYRCFISNAAGEKTSDEALLVVDSLFTKPAILLQPADTDVYVGDTVNFIIEDSGSYLKRQWRKDNVAIPGAASCTLSINDAKSTDAGVYTVKTWNSADSAVSIPIHLRVLPRGSSGLKAQALSASSIKFSWTPIDGALWYRVLRASGSEAFAGICSTSQTSIIDSQLVEGCLYSYKLVAGNGSGENAVKDSVSVSTWYGPRITIHPQPQRILVGQSINLNVIASGYPACTYQWKKNGAILSGAISSSFNLTNAAAGDSGTYSVQVTNEVRFVNSNPANVVVVPTYTLSTTSIPALGGTIVRSKVSSLYEAGESVRITARAASGYRFNGWSGDTNSTDSSVVIIMRKNTVISASFIRQFKVGVSIGKGAGTVSPNHDTLCDSASTIEIKATPATDYRFSSWAGDTNSVNSTISLKVTKDRSINANFIRQYKLGISIGKGLGTISPPKDSLCDSGSTVTVTATSAANYRFSGWTGDSVTASASLSVKMLKAYSLAANFQRRYTLTLSGTAAGTVTPAGATVIDSAASIAISANESNGYRFLGWRCKVGNATIADTASKSTTVILNSGDASVEARFFEIDTGTCTPSISANMNVSGTGPHRVVVETNSDSGINQGTIYRPEDLGPGKNYPIFIWGNGACTQDARSNSAALAEIASHGYFVIADGTPGGSGSRSMTDVAEITKVARAYVTWAIAQNRKSCSAYYLSLDTSKVASNGFSCGGLFGQALAGDPRTTTWGVTSGGSSTSNPSLWNSVHTPVIVVVGSLSDMAYQNGLMDYNGISDLGHPCMFISNKKFGHGGDLMTANGGHFTKINLAWLNWWLKGDIGATGKGALVGPTCQYCTDTDNWEIKSANLP